jgi:hypothetical protein
MDAYEFQPEDYFLEKLLILNLELAKKQKQGIKIVGYWSHKLGITCQVIPSLCEAAQNHKIH